MGSGRQKRKRRPADSRAAARQQPAAGPPAAAQGRTAARSGPDARPTAAQPTAAQPAAPAEQQAPAKRFRLLHGVGGWVAGIVSGVLIAAGGAWLLNFGRSVADDRGPALSAVIDVDPLSNHCYALADPVTSTADRVTLLSGTASAADVMALISRHGGVLVGSLDATLILEGNRSSLRIVDIQPQILPQKPAPAAALLDLPTAGSVAVICGDGGPGPA